MSSVYTLTPENALPLLPNVKRYALRQLTPFLHPFFSEILWTTINRCLWTIGPVHVMVVDNRLPRAPWPHPSFEDINAHCIHVSIHKTQIVYFGMRRSLFFFSYAYDFIAFSLINWSWFTWQLVIRKTTLFRSFPLNAVKFLFTVLFILTQAIKILIIT